MRRSSFAVLLALIVPCLIMVALPLWGADAAPGPQSEAAGSSPPSSAEAPPPAPAQEQPAPPPPAAPAQPAGGAAEQPAPPPAAPPAQPAAAASEQPAPAAETPPALPPPLAEERKEPVLPIPQPLVLPPIVSIEVQGNERIPKDQILAAIKSQPGGQYSEADVRRDLDAIRAMGWFQRVWQESVAEENGVRLIYHVIENPVITDIQFDGNREMTREQLLKVMKTQPGQIYNVNVLRGDGEAIQKLYESQGYTLATVMPLSMSDTGVLTVPIAEGVIEAIRITGNTHTKAYAIRRYIRTQVGETYNDLKVAADVRRLNAQGLFETVRRDAEVGTKAGNVILIFTVVERKRSGMASVGGGYSSVQGLVGFVDLTKANLGGNGQQVSIRGEFGGRTSYELGYENPWVMTPETRLSAGVYDRLILREAFVVVDSVQHNILYDERRSGGNLTLGRPLSDRTTVLLGLRMDNISVSAENPDDQQFLNGTAFQPRNVRSIQLAGINDTRNDVYNPRRGSYQRLSAEFAGIFGGVGFNKYISDSRRFFPVGRTKVLALRLMGGAVTGDAPYLEQFLIGGTESLRGFRTDRFVGTRMAILNTELRFPLSQNLLGVLFVDVGDAWGGPVASVSGFSDVVHPSFQAHLGYGVGVRVKTPIGPLRLDLGFSQEGTETHFGMRHMF